MNVNLLNRSWNPHKNWSTLISVHIEFIVAFLHRYALSVFKRIKDNKFPWLGKRLSNSKKVLAATRYYRNELRTITNYRYFTGSHSPLIVVTPNSKLWLNQMQGDKYEIEPKMSVRATMVISNTRSWCNDLLTRIWRVVLHQPEIKWIFYIPL